MSLHHRTRWSRGIVALVAILIAMRLVWVPLHLAHEHHVDGYGHDPMSRGEALHHEHGDEHEHDGDHAPHPAVDHLAELNARQATDDPGPGLLLIEEPLSVTAAECHGPRVQQPTDEAPKPPPPRSCRARAPPAA